MAARRPQPEISAEADLASLEALLGHGFRQPELLTRALTHRSSAYEGSAPIPEVLADPTRDNEQLEFVGDAVLGLIVAEALYRRYPGSREGELTRLRASVVSRKHLGERGAALDLGRWLRLGHGEEASGGRRKPALLANAMEALIAALYLDAGLGPAQRFVETHILGPLLPQLEVALSVGETFSGAVGDHKSALQEFLQAAGMGQPVYILASQSGPDHRRIFHVEVHVGDGPALAAGEGTSKKVAQQEAARLAFAKLSASKETGAGDA